MAITKHFIEQTPKTAWQLGLAGDEALECLCGGRPHTPAGARDNCRFSRDRSLAFHGEEALSYRLVVFPAHANEFWAHGRNGRSI
jgi:hypothetical protein